MHISCPKCSTKFQIDIKQFGDVARKVKCSKCQHIWHYQLEIPAQTIQECINDKTHKMDNQLNSYLASESKENDGDKQFSDRRKIHLPMIINSAKSQSLTYQTPIIICGLIVVLLVLLFSNSIYEKYLFKSKYLQIEQISLAKTDVALEVSYLIKNNSKYKIYLPPITTKLLDKEENLVKSITDKHKNLAILPGHFVRITTIFKPTPNIAYKVAIDMQNNFNIF
ncbi:MAG: zinc-ribbon domain-containing protein [Rickettsiaceae bacterium]|nr:zinc-ribbon domain-containing protein [Rickettsiaceae bacterium]